MLTSHVAGAGLFARIDDYDVRSYSPLKGNIILKATERKEGITPKIYKGMNELDLLRFVMHYKT
jgi:hypothetical protein